MPETSGSDGLHVTLNDEGDTSIAVLVRVAPGAVQGHAGLLGPAPAPAHLRDVLHDPAAARPGPRPRGQGRARDTLRPAIAFGLATKTEPVTQFGLGI